MLDTADGRARVLAGRIVSPVDEASIPHDRIDPCALWCRLSMKRSYLQFVVRPAGSRALPIFDMTGGLLGVNAGLSIAFNMLGSDWDSLRP
jgi:hypothetical protein